MTDVMAIKMPKKRNASTPFPIELIGRLLTTVQNKDAEFIISEFGLVGQLKKMLAERVLSAGLTDLASFSRTPIHATKSVSSAWTGVQYPAEE